MAKFQQVIVHAEIMLSDDTEVYHEGPLSGEELGEAVEEELRVGNYVIVDSHKVVDYPEDEIPHLIREFRIIWEEES